uniref:Retroviral polymerase SH3-like domain-containing protein n=1 Tax=Chenopodium quinoa TaxID=63459 RepID=A0A803LZ05_CHEQI
MHIWGCPAEARIYNPHEKKLDSRIVSGYFIGYPENSKGYRFYCPNHSTRIVETGNARFLENGENSESNELRKVEIEEIRVDIPLPFLPMEIIAPQPYVFVKDHEQHDGDSSLPPKNIAIENDVESPQPAALRRYQRERKYAISDDYVVYLQESDFDIGIRKDLVSYQSDLGFERWKAAKKVMRYLEGTKDYMLTYVTSIKANGGISWQSKKQSIIASSTMEAEFIACFEASNHALWLRNFILGLGVVDSIAKPLKIFFDNTATVFFLKNGKFSSGSKAMDLKYLVVRERVQKQQVSIENISTTFMIADPLTKG